MPSSTAAPGIHSALPTGVPTKGWHGGQAKPSWEHCREPWCLEQCLKAVSRLGRPTPREGWFIEGLVQTLIKIQTGMKCNLMASLSS